jgi:dihydrofolate reductase
LNGNVDDQQAMRNLIVTENITLDGVIEATEGWFAPAGDDSESDQSDVQAALREQMDAADALLVGRTTFEQMRGYWPKQTDDATGITDYLNRVLKYVVSSTLVDPEWEHTTVLRGPVWEEIRALKSKPGKDIVTTGSVTLVHGLIASGWSTSTGCSCTRWCWGMAGDCSGTRGSRGSSSSRPGRFAPGLCFCVTGWDKTQVELHSKLAAVAPAVYHGRTCLLRAASAGKPERIGARAADRRAG